MEGIKMFSMGGGSNILSSLGMVGSVAFGGGGGFDMGSVGMLAGATTSLIGSASIPSYQSYMNQQQTQYNQYLQQNPGYAQQMQAEQAYGYMGQMQPQQYYPQQYSQPMQTAGISGSSGYGNLPVSTQSYGNYSNSATSGASSGYMNSLATAYGSAGVQNNSTWSGSQPGGYQNYGGCSPCCGIDSSPGDPCSQAAMMGTQAAGTSSSSSTQGDGDGQWQQLKQQYQQEVQSGDQTDAQQTAQKLQQMHQQWEQQHQGQGQASNFG
jgi:hypothetical protein